MALVQVERRTCVYCLEEKDYQPGKRDGNFDSEHVVPESFAGVLHSLTLLGIVCKECNGGLGRTIDQKLARGTTEALYRFVEGQKPVERISELNRRNFNISLAKAEDKSLREARVDLTPENGHIMQRYAVQLIVKKTGKDEWFTIQRKDFPAFVATNPDVDLSDFKILGPAPGPEEFFEEIKAVWPNLKLDGELEPSEHISEAIVDYGTDEQRALAKIGFNYFCYITQDQPNLPFDKQFDPIRKFIKSGEYPGWQVVLPREEPILDGDTVNRRRTNGHIVTFDVKKSRKTGKPEAVSLVSLFNNLTWKIVLQPDVKLPELEPSIHLWDHVANECTKQFSRKIIYQPIVVRRDVIKRAYSLSLYSGVRL